MKEIEASELSEGDMISVAGEWVNVEGVEIDGVFVRVSSQAGITQFRIRELVSVTHAARPLADLEAKAAANRAETKRVRDEVAAQAEEQRLREAAMRRAEEQRLRDAPRQQSVASVVSDRPADPDRRGEKGNRTSSEDNSREAPDVRDADFGPSSAGRSIGVGALSFKLRKSAHSTFVIAKIAEGLMWAFLLLAVVYGLLFAFQKQECPKIGGTCIEATSSSTNLWLGLGYVAGATMVSLFFIAIIRTVAIICGDRSLAE